MKYLLFLLVLLFACNFRYDNPGYQQFRHHTMRPVDTIETQSMYKIVFKCADSFAKGCYRVDTFYLRK